MTVGGDPLHHHCQQLLAEQKREIERLRVMVKDLERQALPQSREEAVSRLVTLFEGRNP